MQSFTAEQCTLYAPANNRIYDNFVVAAVSAVLMCWFETKDEILSYDMASSSSNNNNQLIYRMIGIRVHLLW